MSSQKPNLLYKGRISIYEMDNSIVRVGAKNDIQMEQAAHELVAHLGFSPKIQSVGCNADFMIDENNSDITCFWEENLGGVADDERRMELIQNWLSIRSFTPQTPIQNTIRNHLKQIAPHVKIDVRHLIQSLSSQEKTITISKKKLDRILDQNISVVWYRGIIHGGLISRRIRQHGFCCWRHTNVDGFRGQDVAPFIDIDEIEDLPMDILLHVFKWNWKHCPSKIPALIEKMQFCLSEQSDVVSIHITAHPNIPSDVLKKIIGCSPLGEVSLYQARRAFWRCNRMNIAGTPFVFQSDVKITPKKDASFFQRKNRSQRELFSQFHQGILLDEVGTYSLTPEQESLYIASKISTKIVIDAFGGCGGNTIAFARQTHIEQVLYCESNANRFLMARHNAGIYNVQSKITFIQGDCTEQQWNTEAMIFVDPPWEAGISQIQKWLNWAQNNFLKGIAKLPKEFPLQQNDEFEIVLSSEGFPRYLLFSWDYNPSNPRS